MKFTGRGMALASVILALGAASVLLHDLLVEAALGVIMVVVAAEAVWVTVVARTPEKRVQLVEDGPGQGGAKRIVLYPGDESVRSVHLVKKIGGRVEFEGTVNFQKIVPRSVAGRAGTAQLELRFSTPYAGDYSGQKAKVRVTGPLGLFSSETSIPFVQEYAVYPHTLRVAMATLKVLGRGELGETPTDMPGIGTEFYEMRGYQPSDDYRDVNWRASARRGELIVVEHMREVGGSYLLVLDTRAQGFADTDRLAATFLSLANGLASSGVSFGVLAHDGRSVAAVSPGDSPRSSLGVALRAALSYSRLESNPELLELAPQRPSEEYATGGNRTSPLWQLLQLRQEEVKQIVGDVDPWAAALKYISGRSTRNLLWVSDLNGDVGPLIELAWQARHHHDVEFTVVDPCVSALTAENGGSKERLERADNRRALSSVGAQLYYGEPLVVAQRVLGA
jgi:uncharacterized protein (DUF58 family)